MNLARFTGGNFYWKGMIDEARIESVARSSNWVWATWMTVASNTVLASYSSVLRQPLALSIAGTGATKLLCWPASGVGAGLYAATNLAPPITWTAVTNQPVLVNTQWQNTLPTDASHTRFYRLQAEP